MKKIVLATALITAMTGVSNAQTTNITATSEIVASCEATSADEAVTADAVASVTISCVGTGGQANIGLGSLNGGLNDSTNSVQIPYVSTLTFTTGGGSISHDTAGDNGGQTSENVNIGDGAGELSIAVGTAPANAGAGTYTDTVTIEIGIPVVAVAPPL